MSKETSAALGRIAARAMRYPERCTTKNIKRLAASCLSQVEADDALTTEELKAELAKVKRSLKAQLKKVEGLIDRA